MDKGNTSISLTYLEKKPVFIPILCSQLVFVAPALMLLFWVVNGAIIGPSRLAQASIQRRWVSEDLEGRICPRDMKTKRQIKFSREWQTQLYPGMYLGMDMIYVRLAGEFSVCPACKRDCAGAPDEAIIW